MAKMNYESNQRYAMKMEHMNEVWRKEEEQRRMNSVRRNQNQQTRLAHKMQILNGNKAHHEMMQEQKTAGK